MVTWLHEPNDVKILQLQRLNLKSPLTAKVPVNKRFDKVFIINITLIVKCLFKVILQK